MEKLTEAINEKSKNLDSLSVMEIITLMNNEDCLAANQVKEALSSLAPLIKEVVSHLSGKGRLFYVGAGTSGRLGALDAAECPPTFGTSPDKVQAVMAGGEKAFFKAVEGAEDSVENGALELKNRDLTEEDFVIGITASGSTPFVIGAINYANSVGAGTGAIFCNPGSPLESLAKYPVLLKTGAEVLTGSTRLKAGTATKMVLNMISTAVMVKLGHTYGNLMVDVMATNTKLVQRKISMLAVAKGITIEQASQLLDKTSGDLRRALDE